MPTLRMRITGTDDDARAIANLLQSIEGIGAWKKWTT